MLDFWLPVVGLGMVFQGGLILWVAGFPQVLTGRLPKAEPGSAEAFGIF